MIDFVHGGERGCVPRQEAEDKGGLQGPAGGREARETFGTQNIEK